MPSNLIVTKCPKCRQRIEIDRPNESAYAAVFGGLIIQCSGCQNISAQHVGMGAEIATVRVGAKE